MNDDDKTLAELHEDGEVVLTTLPDQSGVVSVPEGAPRNETPTEQVAKFQQMQDRGIVPDNEDG